MVSQINSSSPTQYMTSPDGINWTLRTLPITTNYNGLAWNGSMWLIASQTTRDFLTSTDGINWTPRTWAYPVVGSSPTWQYVYGNSTNGSFLAISNTGNINYLTMAGTKLEVPLTIDAGLASIINWS